MALRVSQLYIYPIKSLGGIAVNESLMQDRGFQYDRRWMLVDANNQFLTQRLHPVMALLRTSINGNELMVTHKSTSASITFPLTLSEGKPIRVQVWDDTCDAISSADELNLWFSEQLNLKCRLVYMPAETKRLVDVDYAQNEEVTSFSDAYPSLIIGQASLDDLNSRLSQPLPMNRFRPNIVFEGGRPYEEDEFAAFSINQIVFRGVKLCARCVLTTVDQENATKAKEPLTTLATYRHRNNKIYFGQNLLHENEGLISVGDEIKVITTQPGLHSRK